MILSRGRRYLFVHAPKTGGTAMMLALEARAMKDDLIVGDTPKARARKRRLERLAPRGRLWKHARLADLAGVVSEEEFFPERQSLASADEHQATQGTQPDGVGWRGGKFQEALIVLRGGAGIASRQSICGLQVSWGGRGNFAERRLQGGKGGRRGDFAERMGGGTGERGIFGGKEMGERGDGFFGTDLAEGLDDADAGRAGKFFRRSEQGQFDGRVGDVFQRVAGCVAEESLVVAQQRG